MPGFFFPDKVASLSQVNLHVLVVSTGNSVEAELGHWRPGECKALCIK